MKRIVIVGATSGIGLEVARLCIRAGWRVGAAGRRKEALEALRSEAPGQVETETIDITRDDAPERLARLVERLGGMEIYFHASGIGSRNTALRPDIELNTLRTNGEGFVRMVTAAFGHFRSHGGGRIAVISSIAGTKGLGSAPAYSATKRMQNTYIDALAQLSHMENCGIRFTDIRPGFVATPLLSGDGRYPMLMRTEKVAARIMHVLRHPRRRVVIDRRYALMVFFWKLVLKPLGGMFGIYELLPAFIFSVLVIVIVSLCTAEPDAQITEEFDKVKSGKGLQ